MITAFYTRNVVEKRLDVVFHMKSLNFSYIVLLFQSKPVPNILDLFLLGGGGRPPCPLGKNSYAKNRPKFEEIRSSIQVKSSEIEHGGSCTITEISEVKFQNINDVEKYSNIGENIGNIDDGNFAIKLAANNPNPANNLSIELLIEHSEDMRGFESSKCQSCSQTTKPKEQLESKVGQ